MAEAFSNIITPPDFAEVSAHSVLLIDPTAPEIEDLALYLKTSPVSYNVYVYAEAMNDHDWIHAVMNKVSAIVMNTINNSNSQYKDRLAVENKKVWHYGPKHFLMSNRQIQSPIDYFINYSKEK